MKAAALIASIFLAAAPAFAQAPQSLTADAAQAIINGCAAHAAAKNQSFAIAVYDTGANPVAFRRMDGIPPGANAYAMEKAKGVAMWGGFATSAMAEDIKQTPGFATAPGVVTVAGGVAVYTADGKTLLGSVAASGEEPADDEACIKAGVKAAGFSPERAR